MEFTWHSKQRMQQRAIHDTTIRLIKQYGERKYRPGGVKQIMIPKKDIKLILESEKRRYKKKIHDLEKAEGVSIIMDDNGKVITAYKKLK